MRAKEAIKEKVRRNKNIEEETKKRIEDHAEFLHEKPGALEAEDGDFTLRYNQEQLRELLPEGNRQQIFRLNLNHGPYHCNLTRNGQHLVLGGERGQVAVFNWRTKELSCQFNAKEKVRDVCFLHNEMMFAVAQKKHVFIYDNAGLELHCLKQHLQPLFLDFLPYHFLLATASKAGFLKYHDTSTGTLICEHRTKLGRPQCMKHNPYNAVIGVGHSNGIVSMWTPNSSVPIVKVLAHSAPLTSVSFENQGKYMATTGLDGRLKLWDI